MIIAIDGPAASGKSTVARAVAERLGLTFLDTGAMYRAVTWKVQRMGLDPTDQGACARVAHDVDLRFDESGAIQIDGAPGEPAIRSPEVTRAVSLVSAHPGVRRAIVPKQRAIAAVGGVVAEGRDTTTVVFPNAGHKFFLIADSRERARRRAVQEGRPGAEAEIQRELEERDHLDSTRAVSPLVQAPGSARIDTTDLTSDQVVAEILARVGAEDARRR
ncbi:MAG: (d)CMP kinase [Planctomycetota bacterium]|nr:MAG: (d)CMP kinase [Planctomycetota bacterium]